VFEAFDVDRFVAGHLYGLFLVIMVEREVAGEESVREAANAPEIAREAVLFLLEDFWSNVA
jgi:hypothetical protein